MRKEEKMQEMQEKMQEMMEVQEKMQKKTAFLEDNVMALVRMLPSNVSQYTLMHMHLLLTLPRWVLV